MPEPLQLTVNFSDQIGDIRALHGVNMGPISSNGFIDLSGYHRELGFPYTRTHDALYALPGAIDVHCVFPLFDADPDDPANYTFALSDDYVASILDAGSRVYYRLGETIEHHRQRKHYAHPPRDFEKWARICVNIVRHYNEGWAQGFHHGIEYWEVWNEPHHPPCWTGTAEDYYRLYEITARALKAHDPHLKVGGPASGDFDGIDNDAFGRGFLDYVRDRGVPLDFYSWHAYPSCPGTILRRALAAREYLDAHGFPHVENHLNEWNLNCHGWEWMENPINSSPVFDDLAGPRGAAFIASVLTLLQDAKIDQAHFYWGREGWWGLFDTYGRPLKNFYAFRAFKNLIEMAPCRVRTVASDPTAGLTVLAGLARDGSAGAILLSNFADAVETVDLSSIGPWRGPVECEVARIDGEHDLDTVRRGGLPPDAPLRLSLPAGTACLVTLRGGASMPR